MSLRIEVLFLILGCMLVTIIPRVLPLIFAEKVSLSKKTRIWLKQVPPVVISALFFKKFYLPMENGYRILMIFILGRACLLCS